MWSSGIVSYPLLAVLAFWPQAIANPWPEHFAATAINLGSVGLRGSAPVDILVLGWSTSAEKTDLAVAFSSRGSEGLLAELRARPTRGYFRAVNVAYAVRFTWVEPVADGGRRVILITDRPITFNGTPLRHNALKYPFTLIEMRVNSNGAGEGKLSVASSVTVSTGSLLLELADYDAEPIHLSAVRSVGPPT